MTDGSGEVYAVHGGRIVTSRTVDQLRDGEMIQFVNRMPGGGKNKKKMKKVVEESEQSATDKKSTETDVVVKMLVRCFQTGVGGWSAEMMEAMSEMDDEQTEKMLGMLRNILPKPVDCGPEVVIDGVTRLFRERRRGKGDQQQETAVQSTDEGEEMNGPEEMKCGRGSAGCTRGKDEKCQASKASREGKREQNGEGGFRSTGSSGRP